MVANLSEWIQCYDLDYEVGNIEAFIDEFKDRQLEKEKLEKKNKQKNKRSRRQNKEKKKNQTKKIKELEAKIKELEDKNKNSTTNQMTNNFGKIIIKNWLCKTWKTENKK